MVVIKRDIYIYKMQKHESQNYNTNLTKENKKLTCQSGLVSLSF